ncbi:MAG TPA: hypothetical protein PKA41_08705 [Verrucomicrobiota bacterium]|nr:hypothetical protein [Verrucomicrobiota bacterium]
MSRITLTKKRNGRYYIGLDEADFRLLRRAVNRTAQTVEESSRVKTILAKLDKPAPGGGYAR